MGDLKVEWQFTQKVEGIAARRPTAKFIAYSRAALEGPAIVITAHRGDLSLLDERDDSVRKRTVTDQVAGTDDPVGTHHGQV